MDLVVESSEESLHSYGSSITTDSSRRSSNSESGFKDSRVETIKEALAERYPDFEGIDLMAVPQNPSTRSDYEQKWRALREYLKLKGVTRKKFNAVWVYRFLYDHLFLERELKATTVEKYKTALAVPLQEAFGIDISTRDAGNLIRAMKQRRPDQLCEDPQWDLNKVLKYIDEDMPDNLSDKDLLRKTAFLLLLASGMRISELHACFRIRICCKFTSDNHLLLGHHPNFLAKNEDPTKRWKPKVIKPLISRDGSINKLCPVASLKSYLARSPSIKTGRLFQSTGKKSVELTKKQLSTEICKLIVEADPGTRARVHDVRKYASSCSLAMTMITPTELAEAIGWSNPQTFFKFYRKAIEPLSREVSLPGPDPRGQGQ